MRLAISLASTLFLSAPSYAAYNLLKEYKGASFFDGWSFYGNHDNLTNGDVVYVDKASSSKVAFVNDKGNAILKVDDVSFVPWNEKRNSVRIETEVYFPLDTVLLFDATHLPFGCSVWPAFWTSGANWPNGGEIDVLEGINLMTSNQMAIHGSTGCTQDGRDCSDGAGCTATEKAENSFGPSFAAAGGGVWAVHYGPEGISIWFWSRPNVPSSVTSATDTIDIAAFGPPSVAYSSETCDVTKFFTAQKVIINTSLCGDWAGEPSIYQSTCNGDGSETACYVDNVINNGTNYADAYFEIAYVKAFSSNSELLSATISGTSTILGTATPSSTGGTSSSAGTPGSTPTGGNDSPSGTGGNSGGAMGNANMFVGAAAAFVLSAFTWVMM